MLAGRQRIVVLACFALGGGAVVLGHTGRSVSPAGKVTLSGPSGILSAEERPLLVEPVPLSPAVVASAARYGLDAALVQAVILVESGENPHAVSAKGAVGPMQVLPDTAASLGLSGDDEEGTSLGPGCLYLATLISQFGGDVELALAAYNAGPGAVLRWGGVPPYRETRLFVARVETTYKELTGMSLETASRLLGEPQRSGAQ